MFHMIPLNQPVELQLQASASDARAPFCIINCFLVDLVYISTDKCHLYAAIIELCTEHLTQKY